jgi:2-keto-4-pentenoate hydratase/2-oxohepta-3-ene-1,7-dioic acid hydratase in catechol pathway
MWLDVTAEKMQRGLDEDHDLQRAEDRLLHVAFMILEPGDVITTGTPPGVGLGMKPPKFLKAGDVVTLGIEGLGEQRQRFVAYSTTTPPSDTSGVRA